MSKNLSKIAIRNKVASQAKKVIDVLVGLLDHPNSNTRLGAAKVLLNKVLPDLKAEDVKSDQEVHVHIDSEFIHKPTNASEKL